MTLLHSSEKERSPSGRSGNGQGLRSRACEAVAKAPGSQGCHMRSTDPNRVVTAVDDIDRSLAEIAKIMQARPDLREHPSFAPAWRQVVGLTREINARRNLYNKSVKTYNRLLKIFPQNLLTSLFGFVPSSPVRRDQWHWLLSCGAEIPDGSGQPRRKRNVPTNAPVSGGPQLFLFCQALAEFEESIHEGPRSQSLVCLGVLRG